MTPDRNPWLEGLIRPNLRPYSERAPLALQSVGRLLERIGNPHKRLRVVHIAGSKGKGSTALMIEALAQAAGLRTGTFISPHLERWTERFRVGGQEIAKADLDESIAALRPHVDELTRLNPDNPPSFFDVLTAMAFWLFERRGVELAIIETGIGGRFDATNIVRPEVACITNVELEHTDKLGTEPAAIAAHKAGILKPGAAAVLGACSKVARIVIAARVTETGCSASWMGKDIYIWRDGGTLRYRSGDLDIEFRLALAGRHMAKNAALALACVQRLDGIDPLRLKEAAAVLENVVLPGRTEILRSQPWWIVDAAHTPRSIDALSDTLNALPAADRHFIVSLSGDKNTDLLAPLLESASSIVVTSPEPLRSAPADKLASEIASRYPHKQIHVEHDVARAIERAISRLGAASLLCATGSTYIAGAARQYLLSMAGRNDVQASPDRPSIPAGTQAIENADSRSRNSSAQLVGDQKVTEEVPGA